MFFFANFRPKARLVAQSNIVPRPFETHGERKPRATKAHEVFASVAKRFMSVGKTTGVHILGIESSCDETAAAVVVDGFRILSSVVASQIDIHRKYGGVVPELASREHLRQIVPVVREALADAGLSLEKVDAIGVTQGPGLVGSLLVGITYGKTLAEALGKPLVAVNHLEGHVYAALLQARQDGETPLLPAVCLIVSGGHTVLYEVKANSENGSPIFRYRKLGQTRDDAAGEAYDKVAKLLGLGYPGGPILDRLAAAAEDVPGPVKFGPTKTKGKRPWHEAAAISTNCCRYVRRRRWAWCANFKMRWCATSWSVRWQRLRKLASGPFWFLEEWRLTRSCARRSSAGLVSAG